MAKEDLTFLNISQGTVELLESRGMSLTEIAKFLEVSKSYISRVKAGTRAFTLQHIGHVSLKLEQPLPVLLMRLMIPEDSVKPEYRKLYNMTKRLIDRSGGIKPAVIRRKRKTKAA